MKTITEGHRYELANFENKEGKGQEIQFIEKKSVTDMRLNNILMPDGSDYPENLDTLVTINDGTTNEEVLEVLIDRLTILNNKFPCKENSEAIIHMETALLWLNKRTQGRLKRGVEGKQIK